MLELRLLGQFFVAYKNVPIEIKSRPAQSVLAYLSLNAGTQHRREKLAGMFWPDVSDRNARKSLRHTLYVLRKALRDTASDSSEFLAADHISIAFNDQPGYWLDAKELRGLSEAESSLEDFKAAVGNYKGELLPGFYEDWTLIERERMRAIFEKKIQYLVTRLLENKSWEEVFDWAEQWISQSKSPEPAYRALMLAHAGRGDLYGLEEAYQRCRSSLMLDLGVQPSKQTDQTYQLLKDGRQPGEIIQTRVEPDLAAQQISASQFKLNEWHKKGVEVLDLQSLAIFYRLSSDMPFDRESTELLVKSALYHDIDLEPWVTKSFSPASIMEVLVKAFEEHPRPRKRLRIVDALAAMESTEADQMLLEIASADESAEVKVGAALAICQRGYRERLGEKLQENLSERADLASIATLVAVIDEAGKPESLTTYPKLQVSLLLAVRRWQKHSSLIIRQMALAGLGGGLMLSLHGLAAPLYVYLAFPKSYFEALQYISIPAWMLSGALGFFLIGGSQGVVSGIAAGFADAFSSSDNHPKVRLLVGLLSGAVLATYFSIFTLTNVTQPLTGPEIYVPIYFLYGPIIGLILSTVIPKLGADASFKHQLGCGLIAAVLAALVTVPQVMVIHREEAWITLPNRLILAVLLPIGIALALQDSRYRLT